MSRTLRFPALWAWFALLGATAANWFVMEAAAPAGHVVILAIALVKVRIVIRYFMEVREAPRPLGLIFDVWLAIVGASLMLQSFGMFSQSG